jgi:phenylacetic acid degradation operon negative regulatory protein
LLVTIYGLYARERGGVLSVATLVRLLAAVGVDGPAARSLISRLKTRGILLPATVTGSAGYRLTDDGWTLLNEGDRRIYGRPRARLSDGWLLAVFSVPESQRAQRHSLRARLTDLGFGTVSAGVWIAPAHLAEEAGAVLRLHRLDQYVELFTAAAVQADPAQAVARWWDLDALAALYRSFVAEYRPVLARWHRADPDGGDVLADYVRAVTAWRRLPYRDPGLPAEVLPGDWPGTAASDLFAALRSALAQDAERFVATVDRG